MRTSRLRACAALVLSVSAAACDGPPTSLEPSPHVPAARGNVRVHGIASDNTKVALSVEHLARPDSVVPGAAVYVVWARPLAPDGPPHNLGALRVDDDLRGGMIGVTSHRNFELLVTPEVDPAVAQPANEPVLAAKVTR